MSGIDGAIESDQGIRSASRSPRATSAAVSPAHRTLTITPRSLNFNRADDDDDDDDAVLVEHDGVPSGESFRSAGDMMTTTLPSPVYSPMPPPSFGPRPISSRSSARFMAGTGALEGAEAVRPMHDLAASWYAARRATSPRVSVSARGRPSPPSFTPESTTTITNGATYKLSEAFVLDHARLARRPRVSSMSSRPSTTLSALVGADQPLDKEDKEEEAFPPAPLLTRGADNDDEPTTPRRDSFHPEASSLTASPRAPSRSGYRAFGRADSPSVRVDGASASGVLNQVASPSPRRHPLDGPNSKIAMRIKQISTHADAPCEWIGLGGYSFEKFNMRTYAQRGLYAPTDAERQRVKQVACSAWDSNSPRGDMRLRQLRWLASPSADGSRIVEPSHHELEVLGQIRAITEITRFGFTKAMSEDAKAFALDLLQGGVVNEYVMRMKLQSHFDDTYGPKTGAWRCFVGRSCEYGSGFMHASAHKHLYFSIGLLPFLLFRRPEKGEKLATP